MFRGDKEFLQDIAKFMKEKFHAQRVILFGSYAYGNPDLVVKKTDDKSPIALDAKQNGVEITKEVLIYA